MLALLLVGDAHRLNNDRGAAERAYRDAQRAFDASNAGAKDMLLYQGFPKDLEARREALR